MTLLDSIDSILMLYSYTGFPEQGFRLFEHVDENGAPEPESRPFREAAATSVSAAQMPRSPSGDPNGRCPPTSASPLLGQQSEQSGSSNGDKKQSADVLVENTDERIRDIRKRAQRELAVKRNMMSGLSIVLTLMSIIVAFRCAAFRSHLRARETLRSTL